MKQAAAVQGQDAALSQLDQAQMIHPCADQAELRPLGAEHREVQLLKGGAPRAGEAQGSPLLSRLSLKQAPKDQGFSGI